MPHARSSHASTKATAVVDVGGVRDAAGGEGGLQRGGQAHGVLGEPEPVPDCQPGVVVQEREQVGLAAADLRAVQRVTDPPLVQAAASNRPNTAACPRRPGHQLKAVE